MTQKKDKATSILIIENEPDHLFYFNLWCQRAGMTVDSAVDGNEGIKKAKSIKPDCIVLDLKLPPQNTSEAGFDIIDSLRKNKATAGIPIIVMTAYISEENRTRALGLTIHTFLRKPLTEESFIGAIMSTVPAEKKFGSRLG